jgi:uncharacterized membrane protein
MAVRFLIYGLLGLAVEVLFTGFGAGLLRRDRALTGHSYVWMLPIYGAGGLGLEVLHTRLLAAGAPWWGRGLAYVALIYALEYASGWLLRRLLGRCPWDYGRGRLSVHGLVRLDYAPAWLALGLAFERVRPIVEVAAR